MNVISSLIHQDLFFAVISYLALGLAVLLYFLHREKKWERELAQYQFRHRSGKAASDNADGKSHAGQPTAEIYLLSRHVGKQQVAQQAQHADDEMQVIDGEMMDAESLQLPPVVQSTSARIN